MDRKFDWTLRTLPRWTPASRFGPHEVVIEDDLLYAAEGAYLMINKGFGADSEDPAVGAILWAQSREAALLIYSYTLPENPIIPAGKQPPAEVLGFEPASYGSVVQYHRSRGERLQEQSDYSFPDGKFTHTTVSCNGVHYCFPSLNPESEEGLIGVRFDLPSK